MGQALETNRLNPLAPTFTCQTLAAAIDGLPGVMIRPNQREIGGILDRMGVSMTIRNYRRNTEKLVEVLPEWKAEAERVLSRERERYYFRDLAHTLILHVSSLFLSRSGQLQVLATSKSGTV